MPHSNAVSRAQHQSFKAIETTPKSQLRKIKLGNRATPLLRTDKLVLTIGLLLNRSLLAYTWTQKIKLVDTNSWLKYTPKHPENMEKSIFRALELLDDNRQQTSLTGHFYRNSPENIADILGEPIIDTDCLPLDIGYDPNYPIPTQTTLTPDQYVYPASGEDISKRLTKNTTTAVDHTYLRANTVPKHIFHGFDQYQVGDIIESIIPSFATDNCAKIISFSHAISEPAICEHLSFNEYEDDTAYIYELMETSEKSIFKGIVCAEKFLRNGEALPYDNDDFPTVITYFLTPKGFKLQYDIEESSTGTEQGKLVENTVIIPANNQFVVLVNKAEGNLRHFVLGAIDTKNNEY